MSKEWFDALHDALVYGKNNVEWCSVLISMGADFNQIELYDAPIDTLKLLAKLGMDMNLGPLPELLTPDQRRVFYLHGHVPKDWKHVFEAFTDAPDWSYLLYKLHSQGIVPERMTGMIKSRRAITVETIQLQKALT